MQDVMWVGLAVLFFLFSGWFVAFTHGLMPPVRRERVEDTRTATADRREVPP